MTPQGQDTSSYFAQNDDPLEHDGTASDTDSDDSPAAGAMNNGDSLSESTDTEDQEELQTKKGRRSSSIRPKKFRVPRSWFHIGNADFSAKGKVSKTDGRLNLSVNEASNHQGYFAKALGSGLHKHLIGKTREDDQPQRNPSGNEPKTEEAAQVTPRDESMASLNQLDDQTPIPKLNIVVMVIGSRGDIQPFIRIAKVLRDDHGHRVRVATHPAFKDFIEKENGLEFFSIGGNPSELMAFMVKNPGLLPHFDTIKKGEIGRRRDQMAEMFAGFWRSCVDASDGEGGGGAAPFVADAIISNPPVMIHVHCAERLGCPLHIMFTFPYTPTRAFPHPLANIHAGNVDSGYTNFMSFPLVELMTWSGLGDLVNDCRVDTLGLDPVNTIWAPGQLYRQQVPYTYLWSPALCPKPKDWGQEINIAGYVFLEMASDFAPPDDLQQFLDAGDPPVYIGFGSIVVDDAEKFTQLILEAAKRAGVRAVVNKGWGGIGGGDVPEHVFMIDNVPHDWLFPRCKAVVHHGGAGTTAIGLKLAKPTVIVPFFGDQPFWGQICADARAGAHRCVPYKELTAKKLAKSIKQCFSEESQKNVQRISDQISREGDGAKNAVRYFHSSLPLRGTKSLRGSILEDRAAAWHIKGSGFRLSPLAAEMMVQKKKIKYEDLRGLRIYPWTDFQGAGAPITGLTTGLIRTFADFSKGVASGPLSVSSDLRKETQNGEKKAGAKEVSSDDDVKSKSEESGKSSARRESQSQQRGGQQSESAPTAAEASKESPTPNYEDLSRHAGRSVSRPLTAIAQAPMEILLGIGQGLHNAPRLYGDETVRRPVRITGIKSGMYASAHEFAMQSYDAVTGMVTQPYTGGKERGAVGAIAGVGKGIGGLAIKGSAAVTSPLGLMMKGVEKEAKKGQNPMHKIRQARIAQGQHEMSVLAEEERERVSQMLDQGLATMEQLWEEGNKLKKSGWTGQWKYWREKQRWIDVGAVESAEMSRKALEARQRGVSVDEFMDANR